MNRVEIKISDVEVTSDSGLVTLSEAEVRRLERALAEQIERDFAWLLGLPPEPKPMVATMEHADRGVFGVVNWRDVV